MATAYLGALAAVAQERKETISEYLHRDRFLVLKMHLTLDHKARECIHITSFMFGLHDRQLAASLAVVKMQTEAEAERLAAERQVVGKDQNSRKYTGNYVLPTASNTEPEEYEEEESNLSDAEAVKNLMAALSDLKNCRENTTNQRNGRREATRLTKCFNCQQYGRCKSDCPQLIKSKFTTGQSVRPTIECQLCAGNHFVKECPQLEKAKQWLSQKSTAKGESKSTSARTSVSSDSSSVFKKDGTGIVYDTE